MSKLKGKYDVHISLAIQQKGLHYAVSCDKILANPNLHFSFFIMFAATAAKSLQSCPTLCDPIDGSPLGSPIPGILQARTLEWVAISFSNAWKWNVKRKSLSRVRLFATPWTAAYQAPLSMGFARQEYWSGVLIMFRCQNLLDTLQKLTNNEPSE